MKVLYLETSALLAWLFNETTAGEVISKMNQADLIVSSELLRVETCRALLRAEQEELITADQYNHLLKTFMEHQIGWFRMSMDLFVVDRASEGFPVEPVRSLDAIHLATALEYKKLYPELMVLSFDRRILANLQDLGLAKLFVE